ncbi:S-formylglutathione hydrolase [Acidithiobacillus sulfuriphilus]|uniref:S-formylglutathione hydrolase n=1 Tax=Acidithiobacillus sulfuriphilus TaxID=1867749 RepID=UPI003F5EBFC3
MSEELELLEEHTAFGGRVRRYRHASQSCAAPMSFSIYLPPQAAQGSLPVLYFLAGLTCTEETFMIKAGAQRYAAEHGILLVAPDTSPRATGTPGEDEDWDFGSGAGFYVDATAAPWSAHYRMYRYVTEELPALVARHFPADPQRESIFGHSMGGHGALVCALRNPGRYRSVSAFAPVCAPSRSPWGRKAFSRYLGGDERAWRAYDSVALLREQKAPLPILIDQGLQDPFLEDELKTHWLEAEAGDKVTLRWQEGYDHSYYFIASFVGEHLAFHARHLR